MSNIEDTITSLRKRVDTFQNKRRPWSIAELRVTEEEYADLREWYQYLDAIYRSHYWKALILMVEINRRICVHMDEEKLLWPPIYEELYELNQIITNKLFISNSMNPKSGLYEYIESTAYSNEHHDGIGLSYLRDLFGYEDGKNYYNFMNLQSGLTRRTISRLQDWVSVYYDDPDDYFNDHRIRIAVRCLLSGHISKETRHEFIQSQEFVHLWKTIRSYTTGQIDQPELRLFLTDSPWVLPEWVELIIQSTPQPKKRYTGNSLTTSSCPKHNELQQWLDTSRIIYINGLIRFEIPVFADVLGGLPAIKNLSPFEPFTVRCGDDEIIYSWNKSYLEPDLSHQSNTLCGYLSEHHNLIVTIHDEDDHELASELVHLLEFDGEPCLYALDGKRTSINKRLDPNRQYHALWPVSWNWSCGRQTYMQNGIEFCSFTASDADPLVITDGNGDEIWRSSCREGGRESAAELRKLIEFNPTSDGFTIFPINYETKIHSVYIGGSTEGFELVADNSGYVWNQAGAVTRSRIPVRVKLQGHGNPFTPYDDEHQFMNPCEFIAYSETPVDQMSWIKLRETDYVEIDATIDRPALRYWPGSGQRHLLSSVALCEDALYGGTVSIGFVTEQGDVNVSGRPTGMGGRYSVKLANGSLKILPFVSMYRGCIAINAVSLQLRDSTLLVLLRHQINADRKVTVRVWDRTGINVYYANIEADDNFTIRVDNYKSQPYLVTVLADGNDVGWASADDWYKCYDGDMNPTQLVENLTSMKAPILDIKSLKSLHRYFCNSTTECVRTWIKLETHDRLSGFLLRECVKTLGYITAEQFDKYKHLLGVGNNSFDTIVTICHTQGPVTALKVARLFDMSVHDIKKTLNDHLFRDIHRNIRNIAEENGKKRNKARNQIDEADAIVFIESVVTYEDILGLSALIKSSSISQERLDLINKRLFKMVLDNTHTDHEEQVDGYTSQLSKLTNKSSNTIAEYLLAKLCERWLQENA